MHQEEVPTKSRCPAVVKRIGLKAFCDRHKILKMAGEMHSRMTFAMSRLSVLLTEMGLCFPGIKESSFGKKNKLVKLKDLFGFWADDSLSKV